MKVRAVSFVLLTSLLAIPVSPAFAQTLETTGSWTAVQSLQPGDEIALWTKNDVTLKGKLASVSANKLGILRKGKVTEFDQGDIRRVYRVKGRSVGKATLIGLGVGTGGGAAAGAIYAGTDDHSESGEDLVPVFFFGAIGAALGTATGAIVGAFQRKKHVLIYEAR